MIYGGFPYIFGSGVPKTLLNTLIYFGESDPRTIRNVCLTDFAFELLFSLATEMPLSGARSIKSYYSQASEKPRVVKEDIEPIEIELSGYIEDEDVEAKKERERLMDYLRIVEGDVLLINLVRDYATYFLIDRLNTENDPSFEDIDTFKLQGSAKGFPLGQVRLATDSRCTTTGSPVNDTSALKRLAIKLDAAAEYVSFNLTQNNIQLPTGDYTLYARAKGQAADYVKLDVKNTDDTDVFTTVYTPYGATKILSMKVYSVDEKLYLGTDDGKIYSTEDGLDFTLEYDTNEDEVWAIEEYDGDLYFGTGSTAKIFKYDGMAFTLSYTCASQTDVYSLTTINVKLFAGTGPNGKVYDLDTDGWNEFADYAEDAIFAIENHKQDVFFGTGSAGKILLAARLYVADDQNSRVVKRYPNDLGYGYSTSQPSKPAGITTDDTYLYVTEYTTDRIIKLKASDFSWITQIGSYGTGDDQFKLPSGICTDGTYLYICDSNNHRIVKRLCSDLSYVAKIGSQGSGNDQFSFPNGVCTDGTNIYIADSGNHRIVKRACSDLSYIAKIGSQGSGDDQFSYPYGICTDDTNIYIADTSNHRIVKRLCSDLSYVAKIGSQGSGNDQFNSPRGIATDDTNLFIADTYNHRIVKRLCSNLSYVSKIGSQGSGNDQFSFPWGVCQIAMKTSYDASDTNIYTLSSFQNNLYAGGDAGNIYKYNNSTWSTNYASGENDIRSLADLSGVLYAGSGDEGKLFHLWPTWILNEDLEVMAIYSMAFFLNRLYLGTGSNAALLAYQSGSLSSAIEAVATEYSYLSLPFRITDLEAGDTIKFLLTKYGSTATWINVDLLCVVAEES